MKKMLASILLCLSSTTYAVDFDIGIGVSKKVAGGDGLWYVDPFEKDMKMIAPAFDLGITQNILDRDDWGLDARLGFVYLGEVNTLGYAPSFKTKLTKGGFDHGDFKGIDKSNPCVGACTNLTKFEGKGNDYGVSLVLEPYLKRGIWRYSAFIGPYIHKTTWSEHLTGLNACATCVDENVDVAYKQGWRLGAVTGISVSRGNLTVRYQLFYTPRVRHEVDGSDAFMPAWQLTHLVTIGYKF